MSVEIKRIMFTPDEEALLAMQELEGKGKTKSEIINRAVKVEKAIREAASRGGVVYIQEPNGDREKVLLVG